MTFPCGLADISNVKPESLESPRSAAETCPSVRTVHQRAALESGQSLLEAALFLPVLVLMAIFAVDAGYMFIVYANLNSSARTAAEYSVQGFDTPGQTPLPAAGPISSVSSVAALAVADLASLANSATTATVQVCSEEIGVTDNVAQCSSFGPSGTAYVPATDPEAPTFVLNRIDVTYTIDPPIPLSFFSFTLVPSLQFHRQVSMRAMN